MAISIPAIIDAQITALQTSLKPVKDAATNTDSYAVAPYMPANRVADLIRLLTDLIDSGTLTATGGSATTVEDTTAFTGVNSLIGCKVTFAGNVTAALAGAEAYVISNTVTALTFAPGALPGTPAAGDTFVVEWTTIDKDLEVLEQGRSVAGTGSNPYSDGRSMVNAMLVLISQLGATPPSYLAAGAVNAFGLGNPHGGGNSSYGHGGLIMLAEALTDVRNAVAGYTAPA